MGKTKPLSCTKPKLHVLRPLIHSQGGTIVNQLPSVSKLFSESRETHLLPARLSALREVATQEDFWAEQSTFEEHCGAWETYIYVRVFEATCVPSVSWRIRRLTRAALVHEH